MPAASWAQTSFLGGTWSKTAQGRFDDPAYEISLDICSNWIPIEAGALTRRPGFQHAGTTRNGSPGRVIPVNFKQSAPYTAEFTDGHLRLRSGATLITANDSVTVTAISTANPAVVQTSSAVTWATNDQAYFTLLGTSCPLLQNRLFVLTKSDTTHFSLTDPISGATINGTTLGVGSLAAGTKINRVLDIASPYFGANWTSALLRPVSCDIPLSSGSTPGIVLFNATISPYLIKVVAAPSSTTFATFSLAAAVFKDGPYFDPVPGGTLITPSATIGNVTMTLSFNTYSAAISYSVGDYVTSAGTNYKSLTDANINNTPAGSPTNWVAVSAADAIGPNGFVGADIGRHMRLLSEPAVWASGTTYAQGNTVSYGGVGPSNLGPTYWVSLVGSNVGNIPGADLTRWAIAPTSAQWTWGRITALSNIIDRALAGSVNIGTLTQAGGLAGAFNGAFSQSFATSAGLGTSGSGDIVGIGDKLQKTLSSYVGKNYSGASAQKIQQATIYPSNDESFLGFNTITEAFFSGGSITQSFGVFTITLNLRAKASAPASSSDGTLLGTSGNVGLPTSPVTVVSNDTTTAWNYVWIEMVAICQFIAPDAGVITAWGFSNYIGQVSFFNPPGSGTSAGVTVQIVGAALANTTAIRTWRLGLFGGVAGFPPCGTFHEGRLWVGGLVANRIDSSRSNDPFNMAPTDPNGSVPGNAAISYVFTAEDVNQILWMKSDERGIICGTQPREWLVTATTQNVPLTPTTTQAHPVTKNGCANIEPIRAGGVLVFVQRYARKLLEYFPDVFSGRLTAPNLTRNSRHLTQTFIQELAYQNELAPIIWGRRGDGQLVGWTYKRENMNSSQGPAFDGGHEHTLGSGRLVESICSGPSTDGNLDTLTMVTNDPTTGIRHVEIMTNLWEEGQALTSAWHLDDAVTPSSYTNTATTLTLNGLWHLNGKIVSAFVAGLDAGDYTVASGSITVPIDGTANDSLTVPYIQPFLAALPAVVGFTYNSDFQLLRPGPQKDSGAANGPAFGKMGRAHQLAVLLTDTAIGNLTDTTGKVYTVPQGISFGSFLDSTLLPAIIQTYRDGPPIAATAMFTGVWWSPFDNPYNFDIGQPCGRVARPLPCTIGAFSAFQHTQDR